MFILDNKISQLSEVMFKGLNKITSERYGSFILKYNPLFRARLSCHWLSAHTSL
jgi:hypothetical protein